MRARVVDADPRPSTDLSLADDLFAELTADADASPVASLAPVQESPIALRGRRRYRQTWTGWRHAAPTQAVGVGHIW